MDFIRGSIYYAELPDAGENVQRGWRPVIIVSNNVSNRYSNLVNIVPLTSNLKEGVTHVTITAPGLREVSTALCEQVMTVNKNTLSDKLGEIKTSDLLKIHKAITMQLGDMAL